MDVKGQLCPPLVEGMGHSKILIFVNECNVKFYVWIGNN